MKYNGEQGYGRIGSFNITAETKLAVIINEMSERLINLMTAHKKVTGQQFNPRRYESLSDGQLEIIYDYEGNQYGYDHGNRKSWGF